ncbi:prenyltransferase [bacterium]|nr:MAG: prenyltransferase [bacterium]
MTLRRDFLAGLWRVCDPKVTLASAAGLLVGHAAAAHDGPLSWGWVGPVVFGIFLAEAAKNASGELYDWDSGVDQAVAPEDRSPFSGGKRVLVDGLWDRRDAVWAAAGLWAAAVVCGLAISALRDGRVLALALAGGGLAFFYHAPPFKLCYRGWGEAAVALCYGPLIGGGAYLVQRGEFPLRVAALLAPLGLLIAGFLVANEFPDYRADSSGGKRNLVVLMGRARAVGLYFGLSAAAAAGALLLPAFGWPPGVRTAAVAFVPGVWASRWMAAAPEDTPRVVAGQVAALTAFLLHAALLSAALLFA